MERYKQLRHVYNSCNHQHKAPETRDELLEFIDKAIEFVKVDCYNPHSIYVDLLEEVRNMFLDHKDGKIETPHKTSRNMGCKVMHLIWESLFRNTLADEDGEYSSNLCYEDPYYWLLAAINGDLRRDFDGKRFLKIKRSRSSGSVAQALLEQRNLIYHPSCNTGSLNFLKLVRDARCLLNMLHDKESILKLEQ